MQKLTIIRSARKTLSLQITPEGELLVRAPVRLPEREIQRFVREKQDWIETHLAAVRSANETGQRQPLDETAIRQLADQALTDIPPRVQAYARQMGVTFANITIRNQKGRWGSCSSRGNLNFNCLLMLSPEAVRDYVVVHELAHRRHMDHSADFWAEVAAVLPDYKEQVKWLKTNGAALLARMRCGEKF